MRAHVWPLFGLVFACQPSKVVGYGELDSESPPPAVYETVELGFETDVVTGNPFTSYVPVVFSQGPERYLVDGFYDGEDEEGHHVWRARFMPTRPGTWRYVWQLDGSERPGELHVRERRDPDNHGHVRVDPTSPALLLHDDGTPHYWFAGKWFSAKNYGPPKKQGELNDRVEDGSHHDAYYSDLEVETYLDTLVTMGHNGALLKIGLYPLENDRLSWDLDWIRRAEHWLREMQRRNIYCQINLFDPWARSEGSWFDYSEDPTEHLLNAWSAEHDTEKQNYIRYIVARFAGFSNVYFELVNRVDQFGTAAGDVFVAQANEKYLPWLRAYDPCDLPVGGSDVERVRQMPDLDIEFPRDTTRPPASDSRRAVMLNELVHACSNPAGLPQPAHRNRMIREPENRLCYRSGFWSAFVLGAFGANEASWLDLSEPLDEAVLNVMRDHQELREFIEQLNSGPDELVHNPGFVEEGLAHVGTRAKFGQIYVSYFKGWRDPENIMVRLPPGEYRYRWFYPGTDDASREWLGPISVGDTATSLARPAISEDLVLVVAREAKAPASR